MHVPGNQKNPKPEEAELLFVIKLVENGRMSCFIEQKLTEGTEIEMLGPLGIFSLKDEDTRDLLFVSHPKNQIHLSCVTSTKCGFENGTKGCIARCGADEE